LFSASDPNEAAKQIYDTLTNALLKSNDTSDTTPGKIYLPHPNPLTQGSEPTSSAGSPASKPHKSSTPSTLSPTPDTDAGNSSNAQSKPPSSEQSPPALSNKFRSTLASLGIPEPHVSKSKRRSRRPFTPAEDEALLKGYAVHGFQWTLIQQDARLNLSHRKATDLRDRFRTKFPDAYRDGGSVSGKKLTNQSPSLGPVSGQNSPAGGSTPRPPAANTREQTPTKANAVTPNLTPRHLSSRSRHAATPSRSNIGPMDPAFLPPPQGFLEPSLGLPPAGVGGLSFSLDESSGTGTSSGVETPWEDNTLAPMNWDELT
jgi:hypothetical protein